ncbi:hypothetical protein RHGRI_025123 [Rhododendron griersonianum]|uniref:Uncharacterized protein n=1 Tax=Rhododendron griersonianum TaxID=479676 RepID=A0AAV6JB05_9ERIC|nr:hypothetical protein RHGRI_025123 [Rhododendron griersonianum]
MQESRSQPVNGKKKRKRDRQEPEEQTEIDEEHTQVEQTQPTGSNRCNMQSIWRLLKDTKLSGRHIVSLKKTPFWLLFEAVMNSKLLSDNCRKYDEVVLKIIQSYEEESRSFIVGDRQLKLTKGHVKLIFGISCGEVEMVEANYWLCEHTKLVEVKNHNAVPRVVKWKISDLRKSLKDFEQLSQLPGDKVNHTEVQETAEERKIFDEISGDHGDEQGQVSKDHRGEQGEAKVTEVEPTIGVVHGGEQVGVCGEEEGEKGGVQVSKDDGGEKDDEAEKVQGLDDFNSPICRSYETDSGSTLVPNTLGQMSSPNTTPIASLNTICGTIEEQGKKDANALIDEMKNKIEKLEIEKQNLEIEIIKIQEQNEKALQSRNEENGMLKQRIQTLEKHATALQKKNDKLQNGNKLLLKEKEDLEVKVKELDAKVEDFEIH